MENVRQEVLAGMVMVMGRPLRRQAQERVAPFWAPYSSACSLSSSPLICAGGNCHVKVLAFVPHACRTAVEGACFCVVHACRTAVRTSSGVVLSVRYSTMSGSKRLPGGTASRMRALYDRAWKGEQGEDVGGGERLQFIHR